MNLSALLLGELQQEAATTRKLLERVPQESFAWQPHDKSMKLGQLSAHITNLLNKWLGATLRLNELDLAQEFQPFQPDSTADLLTAFDESINQAVELLQTQPNEIWFSLLRLRHADRILFEMPRYAVFRAMILNHIIHHRGQLSVYLRLLDVPLPFIYGPTADETPPFLSSDNEEQMLHPELPMQENEQTIVE